MKKLKIGLCIITLVASFLSTAFAEQFFEFPSSSDGLEEMETSKRYVNLNLNQEVNVSLLPNGLVKGSLKNRFSLPEEDRLEGILTLEFSVAGEASPHKLEIECWEFQGECAFEKTFASDAVQIEEVHFLPYKILAKKVFNEGDETVSIKLLHTHDETLYIKTQIETKENYPQNGILNIHFLNEIGETVHTVEKNCYERGTWVRSLPLEEIKSSEFPKAIVDISVEFHCGHWMDKEDMLVETKGIAGVLAEGSRWIYNAPKKLEAWDEKYEVSEIAKDFLDDVKTEAKKMGKKLKKRFNF